MHEARHTFTSCWLTRRADLKAVNEFIVHSKIQTTFDTYRHLHPGSRDEVRERIYIRPDQRAPPAGATYHRWWSGFRSPAECRHTFAALMIAAGVNAKALQTYMGHANISITLDQYGHLMPWSENEAAGLLDAYLRSQRERADDDARSAPPANSILR
jgi:integrase